MAIHFIYSEKLSSKKTEILFIILTMLFLLLLIWRVSLVSMDFLASVFICFFGLFLFYSINYRTLVIQLSPEALRLSFGIFSWTILLSNVADIQLDDDLPGINKYGGAGIHFMFVRKRYRVSFNFLEYSRVVIRLVGNAGLVKDVSFSTCQPDEILRLLQGSLAAK